jgi:hypothetical protein
MLMIGGRDDDICHGFPMPLKRMRKYKISRKIPGKYVGDL